MIIKEKFDLSLNHIGIVIDKNSQNSFRENFLFDNIQGVHILFKFSEYFDCFIEYLTNEGRAKNYKLGFNHLCYNVKNFDQLDEIHRFIIQNDLGIRLTLPEKSISEHCNYVSFYQLKIFNIIEFNIIKSSD